MSVPETPWSEPAGDLERTIALAMREVGVPGGTGQVFLRVRDSFYLRIKEMMLDPRWTSGNGYLIEDIVRDYLVGGGG